MKRLLIILLSLVTNLALAKAPTFELYSSAFTEGSVIPKEYSSQGQNVSPPLRWQNPPVGTKSYVLMLVDFDAEKSVGYPILHWLAYNIPAQQRSLKEGDNALTVGINGYGELGYIGMNPPIGQTHHYTFRLFALNLETLNLVVPANVQQVLKEMNHHILAEATLSASYKRPPPVPLLNNIFLPSS